MPASLLKLQHLAPVPGGFLPLLSTPGVGQVLEINTLPFPQEQLSTKDCWEMVTKEPISLLLQWDDTKVHILHWLPDSLRGVKLSSCHTFIGCLPFPVKLFYSPSSQYAVSGCASRGIQTKKGAEPEMKISWADWQDQQMPSLDCISSCKAMYRPGIFKRANLEADSQERVKRIYASLCSSFSFLFSFTSFPSFSTASHL